MLPRFLVHTYPLSFRRGDGRGVYIRSPLTSDPIRDFTSVALACNTNNSPVPETLEVKPGDKFTFEWYHKTRGDDILPGYARGPGTHMLRIH